MGNVYAYAVQLALGLMFSTTTTCIGSWFLRKRSLMVGIGAGGAATGTVVFPIALNRLFDKMGWARALQVVGAVIAATLIVANIIVVPRKLQKRSVPVLQLFASFLRQKSSLLSYIGTAAVMTSLFIPLFQAQIFAESWGASDVITTYTLTILNSTAVVARVVAGLIADRCGVFNTQVPVAFSMSILNFAFFATNSTAATVVFDLLFGCAFGCWVTIMPTAFMSLAEHPGELGARTGLGMVFVSLAVLCGTPIAGALISATGGRFWASSVFGGTAALIGATLIVFARQTQVLRKGSQRV
ncbi:hypothetical protein OIO90_004495 [Microbotryomycetes sp. JL221]|nr:hypothetical protein OIO90_004495 [Microbotryomycetes sp. JL221]